MSLEEYRQDILECVRCSNCKYVQAWSMKSQRFSKICPSNARYLFDAYSCQGKMDVARAIMEGHLDYKDSLELIDIIYKCTLCGACDTICKFFMDIEPLLVFKELRVKVIEDAKTLPAHKAIMDSVKSYNNVWMQPRTKRSTWAKGLDVKDISKEKAEVLYYVGCTYAYNTESQRVARETVTILKNAGVDFGILGDKEVCCGSPIARIGDQKLFSSLAKENIDAFNNLKVDKVITSCAGCYSTIKADYPQIGKMNFKVLHAIEYIDQLIKEGKVELIKEVPFSVTWHDPCHLGRLGENYIPWEGKRGKYGRYEPPKELRRGVNGVYEPPRNILKSIPGLELIEMERMKEHTWCCGSGGGVKSAFPDFALWSAQERIEEALSTGAEALVTSCPWCEANFMDAIKAQRSDIELYSLVDLVCLALG